MSQRSPLWPPSPSVWWFGRRMRLCSSCQTQKEPVEFYRNRANKDGLSVVCKACQGEASRRYSASEKGREAGRRACASHRIRHQAEARLREQTYNKSPRGIARTKRAQERMRNKPEIRARYFQRWYGSQAAKDVLLNLGAKRRLLMRSACVESVARFSVWERECGRCWMCGKDVVLAAMHVDHIIPLSRGGPHAYANVGCACRLCNSAKRNKLPSELGLTPPRSASKPLEVAS